MMKIWCSVLFIALILSTACGSEPDIETTMGTKTQSESAVVPTLAPTPESSPANKSITSDSDPKIKCVLNKEESQVTCMSTNIEEGSQLKWTSTASDAYSGGSNWQFTINKQQVGNVEKVFLDICQGSTCQTFETSIDTSELASVGTQKNITPESTAPPKNPMLTDRDSAPPPNNKTPSPRPVLNLPFATDQEPEGMMPMVETILHPATTDNPNGHPGIDFQWPFRAKVIAATNGKVLEIRTSNPRGSILYFVLVMSGDFVVTYDVLDIYSFNPDLDVGSEVVSGQVMGYAEFAGSDGVWTSMHWSFGKWLPGSEKPNPEGVVEKFRVDYMCPVPYFSEIERLRLFRLWDTATYPDGGGFKGEELRKQFPDVCNGPYKNY